MGAKITEDEKTAGNEAGRGSAPRSNGEERRAGKGAVAAHERWRMIAEAAYYRERSDAFEGDPEENWRAAEAEVDRRLAGTPQPEAQAAPAREDEQAAYQRLREEVQQRLAAIKGTVDAKAIQDAFERATVRVRRAGDYAGTTVNRAAERLGKEMRQAAAGIGPRWEAFSGRTAGVFAVWRDRGAVFLSRAATAVGDWLNRTGRRFEAPRYRTGSAVSPGSFECARCGARLRKESAGPLPPCPTCHHTEFRREPS